MKHDHGVMLWRYGRTDGMNRTMSNAEEGHHAPIEHESDAQKRLKSCAWDEARGYNQEDNRGNASRVQIEAQLQVK